MKNIIRFFSGQHLLVNFTVIALVIGAFYVWENTGKEELPNIDFDVVRIGAAYPGATAENMDVLVTRVLEATLDGIDGIVSVRSTSSQGAASIFVELDKHSPNRGNVVADITDAVLAARLPAAVETPTVREFKSSRFSVIDVALSFKDTDVLTDDRRVLLQARSDALEDRLKRIPGVSEVSRSASLDRSIDVSLLPERLAAYGISLREVSDALKRGHINQPVGTLEDGASTKIKLEAELADTAVLNELVVRANFEGRKIRLGDLARVSYRFPDRSSIFKIDGNEAVLLSVTKSSSVGILEVVDRINEAAAEFRESLEGTGILLRTLQDESIGVRNRLSIIASNGLMGFILVVAILFIFLDAKSGLWVAMGIPFILAATMILAGLMGQTVNNMTLAAVIVAMGMIVDTAIVVAENVSRLRRAGLPRPEAVVEGTAAVFAPVVASITTTCAAFIPLFFFRGRFGLLAGFLPPVIFIMLAASLAQALFVLPAHLSLGRRSAPQPAKKSFVRPHWFTRVENRYGRLLKTLLPFKFIVFAVLAALLVYSGWVLFTQMRFSLFPREESTEVFVSGALPRGTDMFRTEEAVRGVEEVFLPYVGKEVTGFRSRISRSRWGGAVRENEFSLVVELVERTARRKSNAELIGEWEAAFAKLSGFESLSAAASRFGQSSGSAVDVVVQESDDGRRRAAAERIRAFLEGMPAVRNPQIEAELVYPQNAVSVDRVLAERLGVDIATLAQVLRTVVSGETVYTILVGDKEVDVNLTVDRRVKRDMNSVLDLPVPNNAGYLVPLRHLVSVRESTTPDSIVKLDGKRTLHVYADLAGEPPRGRPGRDAAARASDGTVVRMTPLEVAEHLEKNLFPALRREFPGTEVSFGGEIAETRESGRDFEFAVLFTVALIYVILALTLKSLGKPLIILLAIPFGMVGVVLTLQTHGILIFGFFSAVGALGLAGVVVNNSIVLLDKLEKEYDKPEHGDTPREKVANITKTRLRAVLLTTLTTVCALFPTAYGVFGYDTMLSEMMLTMAWGLVFGTVITLMLVPSLYCWIKEIKAFALKKKGG